MECCGGGRRGGGGGGEEDVSGTHGVVQAAVL